MITLKTTDPCVLSTDPWPTSLPTESLFNVAYWAAQPLALQAAGNNPFSYTQAQILLSQNLPVDNVIMVWGWSPYKVMMLRLYDGYLWVPNAGQPNVSVAPNLTVPGLASYNASNPPIGAISVSLNLADYPSFVPPAPPPKPVTELVGTAEGIDYPYKGKSYPLFYTNPSTDNSAIPNGGTFTDSRGTFTKVVSPSMFDPAGVVNWILTALPEN